MNPSSKCRAGRGARYLAVGGWRADKPGGEGGMVPVLMNNELSCAAEKPAPIHI